jgi:Fe-S oxidoreductase
MCPSYQATRNEKDTTRGRANILREYITNSEEPNPFNHQEIYDVLDLCLSCKACKSECPSSVDMTKLKAEFLQHFYESHRPSYRTIAFANFHLLYRLGANFPALSNYFLKNKTAQHFIKKYMRIAPQRKLPLVKKPFSKWPGQKTEDQGKAIKGTVFLFADEFTEYYDGHIGEIAVKLLKKLGYEVKIPKTSDSGRALLSKGFLKKARKIAEFNISVLSEIVSEDVPLLGIEPSAILVFRDEYPELVSESLRESAKKIGRNALLFEEFFMREAESGRISPDFFTTNELTIKLHGHCHQKAIASTETTIDMLSFPKNYRVEEIDSGCCGMAGSFGYEKEHYEVSMKIGELRLFPAIRKTKENSIIAANGISCRQQIFDGTQRKALHPVEILYDALIQ